MHSLNSKADYADKAPNRFEMYDIQNLAYDIVKEYNHFFKADYNKDFMKRMLFDIFKRQIKDKKLTELIEKNKVKIDEESKLKTFDRLIEDANRRLQAQKELRI